MKIMLDIQLFVCNSNESKGLKNIYLAVEINENTMYILRHIYIVNENK